MIEHKQLFRHRPEDGMFGDCHRTAIACLLDLDPEEVPHFGAVHFDDPEKFHSAFERWLKARGLRTVLTAYDCSLEDLLASFGSQNPEAYFLLGGRSRSGVGHTVIGCGNRIAWDPHPDDVGIVGPLDGYYWVNLIVPAFMCASEKKQ